MKSTRPLALPALLLALVLSPAAPAAALLKPPSAAPAAAAGAGEDAEAAIAADERLAADLVAQRDALHAEAAAAPARAAKLEAELRVPARDALRSWQQRLPDNADRDTLEALLETERLAVVQLRSQRQTLTSELAQTLAGDPESGNRAGERQRRLEQLQSQTSAAPADDGTPGADDHQRRAAAEARRLQAEVDLDATRQDLAGTRQRLLELELRAVRHRLSLHEPREGVLQRMIAALGRQQLREVVAGLETAATAVVADPLIHQERQANLALGREMLAVNEALAGERAALAAESEALERDRAALANGRTRLEVDSRSEQVGIWLWAELRQLEPDRRLRQQLADVRDRLATLRLRLIGVDEQQRDLADVAAAARALRRERSSSEDGDAGADVGDADPLEQVLEQQLQLSEQLEPMLWRRIATLEETERSLQARLDANRELRQLMDRHLLWIRSHPAVDAAWLERVPEGLADQFKVSRFATTWELLREDFAGNALPYVAAAAVLALLVLLRRRAPKQLEALGQTIRDVREDSFRRTMKSLGWTLAAALPWPTAALAAGLLLRNIGTVGKYSDSLGYAFVAMAPALLTVIFLHWLVRERGLAHAHFRWTRQRREALQAWLPWMGGLQVPLYFLVTLAFVRNQELAASVQGRIGVVASMLAWAAGIAWLLAPERAWHTRTSVEPSRLRQALRVLVPAGCVAAAWLALDGYVWSTLTLARSLFASIGVLVLVSLVQGLLTRWFVLGARRLALKRYLDKRAETADATAEPDGGESIPVEVQEEITLEKVGANSRALLRVVRLSLLTVGLVVIWGQVLLALFRFDEVPLWTVAGTAADGSAIREQITLLAVLTGALVLWLTVVAARNVPGLIEIGLQSRSSVDAASRYAVTSVTRYAIVVVGFVIGLGLLGLRWGQLQWMAAALTLGLGFGLQEIFANFVSGLILLFERPFRVGDTITVNNLDGTVTRIRTRATTILDFDNKEIVVPNKSFITGQLVNWTLTDETTRIVVKVGVDYGTDPALVHRLMLQAAEENPRVLKDWPTRSWLMGFGANSLDFELRVFVGTMSDRLAVRNELNMRLIELFEDNGIGFAFPQLDVHVRDLPAPVRPVAVAGGPDPER